MEKTKNQITQFVIWFALLFGVAVFTSAVAQTKYLDKNGVVIFEASEKLFEEVKAVNVFRGKLVDYDANKDTKAKLKGTLEIRGKKKEIETILTVQKVNGMILLTGDFVVSPADFDIEIPKIVRNKIAKEVQVKLDFKLERNDT